MRICYIGGTIIEYGATMDRLKKNLITKVDIDQHTGCWNFNGCVQSNGYGRLTYRYKTMGAHRWSYIAFIGDIPKGFDVCHKCDNRKCINPEHLFAGTRKENMQDAVSKGRQARGFMLPITKLSDSDVIEIIEMSKSGMKYKEIAEKFNVSKYTANDIAIKAGVRRNGKRSESV